MYKTSLNNFFFFSLTIFSCMFYCCTHNHYTTTIVSSNNNSSSYCLYDRDKISNDIYSLNANVIEKGLSFSSDNLLYILQQEECLIGCVFKLEDYERTCSKTSFYLIKKLKLPENKGDTLIAKQIEIDINSTGRKPNENYAHRVGDTNEKELPFAYFTQSEVLELLSPNQIINLFGAQTVFDSIPEKSIIKTKGHHFTFRLEVQDNTNFTIDKDGKDLKFVNTPFQVGVPCPPTWDTRNNKQEDKYTFLGYLSKLLESNGR